MHARRWQEIKQILDAASRLAVETRPGFIERACAGDSDLRREVESLLACHELSLDVVDRPLFDIHAEDAEAGRRLGHYRIVGPLGRGGMGAVYLARREDDYSQRVAVKLIRQRIASSDWIARFHEERQILADLDHPAIARLLDGGTTEEGLPYLVMELVEGEPIDRYCDARRLAIRERLELFRQVLEAVETSHRHLIVHRDLKPDNILVAAGGRAKLIDFGIAKLLQPSSDGEPPPAAPQHRKLMSPRYASPEQLRGGRITTASDIYSLGVILYELLCGRRLRPADVLPGEEAGPSSGKAVPPSLAVRSGVGEPARSAAPEVAAARGTTPRGLERRLVGDLDAIVMEALGREPEERYGSVEQLSADIGRHLSGFPVAARRGDLAYRAWKFVRRHRLALLAAALALAVAGSLVAALDLRARAARERARNVAIERFVQQLFRAADPDRAEGEDPTVRELLDQGRAHLGAGLDGQPLVRAALLAVVGRVYLNLGDWDQAEELLAEALRIQRREDPRDAAAVARRASELAAALHERGDLEPAEPLYREALARLGGCRSASADALWIAGNLAWLRSQRGDDAEAEALVSCLRDRRRKKLPVGDDAVASILSKLGALRYGKLQLAEAEALFREALEIRESYHKGRHTKVANTLNNLGKVLHARGRHRDAEAALRRALDIRSQLLDEDHADIANTRANLAQVLIALGDAAAAEALAGRAVETLRFRLPRGHWKVAEAENVLAASWAALGRCDEAAPLLIQSAATVEREKGADSPYTRAARQRVALSESCLKAWRSRDGRAPPDPR